MTLDPGHLSVRPGRGSKESYLCQGTSSNRNIIQNFSSQQITSKPQCSSHERGSRVPYQIMPCMQHWEFDLLALLVVTPVELEWGVKLLSFLLLLCGVVIVVLQPLDSVVVAHCSHGVWHSHSWAWLFGRNYCA